MSLGRVAQFEMLERLGEGGMGEVFRAMDTMLEREVAIKALRPALAERPDLVERFRVEAIALAKLNHPNIAAVYNFIQDHGTYYMVMLFVRGRTLEQVLAQRTRLPWQEALGIVAQALRALQHAHGQGVIHRDLKPANLMLRSDGTVVVMDFGIARVLARARQTRSGNMVGTLEYMSPEQVQGKDVDGRADFYALGVMLYEMLTGRLPFIASTDYDLLRAHVELTPPPPSDLCRDVPTPVEQLVRQAMAKDPRQRFSDADQFFRHVEALLPNAASSSPTHGVPDDVVAWWRRSTAGAVATTTQLFFKGLRRLAPSGVAIPGQGPPVLRWTDTAKTMAARNPGLALAFFLAAVALILAVAGAVGPGRKGPEVVVVTPAEPPDVPSKPVQPQQKFPGITIVEEMPKPVEPFPQGSEPAPPPAQPPAAARPGGPDKRPPQRSEGGWYVR